MAEGDDVLTPWVVERRLEPARGEPVGDVHVAGTRPTVLVTQDSYCMTSAGPRLHLSAGPHVAYRLAPSDHDPFEPACPFCQDEDY